ncbi:hypothetical protein ANANG_G00305590 [Anguilla anguilla]|uniref:C2H2-type domain-containing protein n=1 Tax=Anguilla anguilla TaxID=7936 RepID=A0A9D3LJR6_ANGAN|nr:hypothetical protein ANANG_G00305590 [Anguilla anguilla]
MAQISRLRKEHAAAEQKRAELDKVALVLGLRGSDKHRREGRPSGEREPPPERGPAKAPEKAPAAPSSSVPSAKAASALGSSPEKQKPMKSERGASSPEKSAELYEYYDSGNHWCKNCNTVCGSMFDFFTHLHSKSHRKTLDPYDRPWAPNSSGKEKKRTPGEKIVRPAKGCEFLVPVMGFYCQLCEEFFGDQICAEEHVTCHKHNGKYKRRMDEYPLYEQRRNLDRQAGLSVAADSRERKQSNELKRRLEAEEASGSPEKRPSSPADEPPSHRDRKSQSSREGKPPRNHKEETFSSHKEETFSSHREEKVSGHRVEKVSGHREEKDPGHREDYPSGHREERRSSVKEEREGRRRTPVREGKAQPQKPAEPPQKPASVPKAISGPSPAIQAKVRKRNEEAAKNAAASASAFGKFSWKKPEKEKEKEKEKEDEVEKEEKATENLTEEEESGGDDGGDKEEGKAALAKTKTIAIKLSGKTVIPPSNAWVPFGPAQPATAPAKIRPTLSAPMMVLRKSSRIAATKPAPLNTFLSIRPPGSSNSKPLPVVKPPAERDAVLTPDLISKAFGGEEVVLKTPRCRRRRLRRPPTRIGEIPRRTLRRCRLRRRRRPPKRRPPLSRRSRRPGRAPDELRVGRGRPGVPESEQAVAVLVCPPPLHRNLAEGPKRSGDKPKSSMAAAKAQDLYDIFYSGGAARSGSGGGGGSDLLAATKPPRRAEAAKSRTRGGRPQNREQKSDGRPSAQTSDSGGGGMVLEEQALEIPDPEKDASYLQMDMVDLDMFTFNFE